MSYGCNSLQHYSRVVSLERMSHALPCASATLQIRMSHVTLVHASYHTYGCVKSHTRMAKLLPIPVFKCLLRVKHLATKCLMTTDNSYHRNTALAIFFVWFTSQSRKQSKHLKENAVNRDLLVFYWEKKLEDTMMRATASKKGKMRASFFLVEVPA